MFEIPRPRVFFLMNTRGEGVGKRHRDEPRATSVLSHCLYSPIKILRSGKGSPDPISPHYKSFPVSLSTTSLFIWTSCRLYYGGRLYVKVGFIKVSPNYRKVTSLRKFHSRIERRDISCLRPIRGLCMSKREKRRLELTEREDSRIEDVCSDIFLQSHHKEEGRYFFNLT